MKRLILALPVALAVLTACSGREYENCPADHREELWGVVNHTDRFGSFDSIYYLVNPIGNLFDSLYYNANYTDSYFHSDSTRIMMAIGPEDSIQFNIDRLYYVQTNPDELIAEVRVEGDTVKTPKCKLRLLKVYNTDRQYIAEWDTTFINLLQEEKTLKIYATNGPTSSEPLGSQNYMFKIYCQGYNKAKALCDSLNLKAKKDTVKTPTKKKVTDKTKKQVKKF